MQLAGDPELVDVKVGEVSRYCWKISGTTAMLAQKKDKAMITGQARPLGVVRQAPLGDGRVLPPGVARGEAEHHPFNPNKETNQAEETIIYLTQITNNGSALPITYL